MASRFSLFLQRTTTTRGFELRLARPSVLDILTDRAEKNDPNARILCQSEVSGTFWTRWVFLEHE